MAYNHGYRQPQRHYQDDYYNGEQPQMYASHPNQRGPPMQQGYGMPQFASQPGSMSAGYENDGMGSRGAGDPMQTRHPPLPVNAETASSSFSDSGKRSIPVPPGSLPIDDSMLAMNLGDDYGSRSMPQQRGPPLGPYGPIPRAQTVQPGRIPGGGYLPHEVLRSHDQWGPPPHQRLPPQRLPPPRGNMPGNGRGFPPGPSRPPVRQNTMGSYGQGRSDRYQNQYNNDYMDDRGHLQSDSGYGLDPGYGPPQRSMTMPNNIQYKDPNQHQAPQQYPQQQQPSSPQSAQPQKQQYTAYNPAQHGTIVNCSAPRTAAPSQLQVTPEEKGHDRESVGALLDSYYHTGQRGAYHHEAGAMNHSGDQLGHLEDPYKNGQRGYAHDPNFIQQAHRTRSQPDLRGQVRGGPVPPVPTNGYSNATNDNHSQNGGHYDGARELPAEVPAETPAEMPGGLPLDEPIVMTANGFPPPPPQSNIPMALRVGSPAPSQQMRQTPPLQLPPPQQQNAFPPRAGSMGVNTPSISTDSLPYHPSPASTRFPSGSGGHSHPDSLPAHPVPVRHGLLHQDQSMIISGHPPPRRQYSPDRRGANWQGSVLPGPITQSEFSQIQQMAKANPGDNKLQLQLAKKMVEAASTFAGGADARTTRKNREIYISDAHKIVKKLANSSHPYPDAMFYLAECYWEGLLGLQIDRERAFNLYQSAAKLNHGPSAYRTAVCCELGAGTRKDPPKSMTWYKKASALGDTAAMYKLGMIMLKGLLGQTRNGREAINWLKRAADQADESNPHALHQLGLIYEQADCNDFVIPDQNYARELFVKAAELGYPPSQFRMGCAYEYGTTGCPIDPMQSIAWYSRAAMQGEEESAMALSGWYLTGAEGVIQQSDTEAYLWARKAAERGLANAEFALGYFTEVGIGVADNLDEAKRWYFKAASQQHEKAKQRLQELKRGGAAVQKSRERLSRSNVKKGKDDGECIIM